MKKISVLFFIFVLVLSFNVVNANTIESINMDIYLDEEGNAHITEIWKCFSFSNTEYYHTYKNIGKSEILNFSVKDEENIDYENIPNWNVNESFNFFGII